MLKWLNPLGLIADKLTEAYTARQRALTDRDRIAADVSITQLEARQAVLIAEQASSLTRWIRPALAAPVAIYIWKVVVWDKVLGLGVTDPLDERMWWVFTVIIGAYFLTRPIEKWIRK